jgi:transcriptional regulator with XRE-family HTH domain
MDTALTLRRARRRADLTQRELAALTGVAQPTVARIERGHENPRVETIEKLLRACGWRLDARQLGGIGIDRTQMRELLVLEPTERLRSGVAEAIALDFALPVGGLLRTRRPGSASPTTETNGDTSLGRDRSMTTIDVEAMLGTLIERQVRFVLIGGQAGRLWGSPTVTSDVDICAAWDAGNRERLADVLADLDAHLRGAPEDVPFLLDATTLGNGWNFTFQTRLGALDLVTMPAGGLRYEDLIERAVPYVVGAHAVPVIHLEDLIHLKRSAGRAKDLIEAEILEALLDELDAGS